MGRVSKPQILGKCKCGEVLAKDFPGDESYWTRYEPVTKLADEKTPLVLCPGCGGDSKIKMGSYHHPNFFKA